MRSRENSGFSFFELMIVVAVAAILVTAAVPQFQRSVAASRLRSSAVQLQSELNYARTIAVSRNSLYRMQLTANSRTYQIIDIEDPNNPPRIAKTLDQGVNYLNVPANPIEFLPRGGARGGTIQLIDDFGEVVNVVVSASGMVQVGDFGATSDAS